MNGGSITYRTGSNHNGQVMEPLLNREVMHMKITGEVIRFLHELMICGMITFDH
jgi:hypothetical protein